MKIVLPDHDEIHIYCRNVLETSLANSVDSTQTAPVSAV